MKVYEKLKEAGITLPEPPKKGGLYSPVRMFGKNLCYVSGCGPAMGDYNSIGKLGGEVSVEEGFEASRASMLNVLAVMDRDVGLDKIRKVVKVLTFVASTPDFYDQPQVANGGTGLLADIFGPDAGLGARSAIGVAVLPGNISVETEVIFELED